MRVLGIDPGLNITGYGCLDFTDAAAEPALVEAGAIRLPARRALGERLNQLHENLTEVCAELRPALVAVEALFSHYRHVRTSIMMGHARGVILLAAQRGGGAIVEIAPTEAKKAITGNGHASKHQVQLAVMAQCRLRELPQPPDVADAIALALCAGRRAQLESASPVSL